MGLVSDFLGAFFGVGYIGCKIIQDSFELDDNKRQASLVQAFVNKYCNKNLEAQFKQMVEDPAQTEKVWQIIVSFVRRSDPNSLFLPIDILEADFYRDRGQYPLTYGWHEIKQGKRVPFHGRYGELEVKNINASLELRVNRSTAIRYLLMTRNKMPEGVARATARYLLREIGFNEFEIKYLADK